MFDYSLLGSFVLFVVVAFFKIRPELIARVDKCIDDIRGSFDETDERLQALRKELDALKKRGQDVRVVAKKTLREAQAESRSIDASTRKSIEETRAYYVQLRQGQKRYWQERLEQYSHKTTSIYVLDAVKNYCCDASHKTRVYALTKTLIARGLKTSKAAQRR